METAIKTNLTSILTYLIQLECRLQRLLENLSLRIRRIQVIQMASLKQKGANGFSVKHHVIHIRNQSFCVNT